jgi:hypothetical protein
VTEMPAAEEAGSAPEKRASGTSGP